MRASLLTFIALCALAPLAPGAASPMPVDSTTRVHYVGTLFEHSAFSGQYYDILAEDCASPTVNIHWTFNDLTSSVHLAPESGCGLILFEHIDGKGDLIICYPGTCADLNLRSFNDLVSSYRVFNPLRPLPVKING